MDLQKDEGGEKCRSMKKLNTFDKNKDFISDLPDPILVHILSFLPINDAIQTVLLRRFGNLWRDIPVLDLDSCFYHECEDEDGCPDHENDKFVAMIDHVLIHHNSGPMDKLSLKFCFQLNCPAHELFDDDDLDPDILRWRKSIEHQIGKLIGYAISKKVKVLDINLRGCCNDLPKNDCQLADVFSSDYLIDLRLTSCDIRGCRNINLKSLRVLVLDKVTLNNELMAEVLVGCPLLEDLSLVGCHGLSLLKCENPNLKQMVLTLDQDEYLVITCPYVEELDIDGNIECALLTDISSLGGISISFSDSFRYEQRNYDDIKKLLNMISWCMTLSLCTWTILVLTMWSFQNMSCPMFGWKNLTLELHLSKWHLPGLSLLFRSCPSLQTLSIDVYPASDNIFPIHEAEWLRDHDFDGDNYWKSKNARFPCLESIMIYGYINKPYMIEMVKFFLNRAKRLKKLVISTEERYETDGEVQRPHFTSNQLLKLSRMFNDLPRASPEAVISFS